MASSYANNPENRRRIAVIGAGPAGLTAAYTLAKNGYSVDVYEADGVVGGMCRTINLWNCKVDIGPHRFFSNDKRVNELWLEIMGRDYEMVNRLTRIFYNGKYFMYPLKPFNAFRNLGIVETFRCLASYIARRRNKLSKADFETWVTDKFGRRLYEIFFKTYSEKLWGIPCHELDADFAAQRIKKLSLFEAIKNAFFGGGGHKTLVDEFAYPLQGTGAVYERMAESIRRLKGNIFLNTRIKTVVTDNGRAKGIELFSGEQRQYDVVISTMPMTTLLRTMANVPFYIANNAAALKFRNTIIVYLYVEGKHLFPDNWLYIHSPGLLTGRITNFRNWTPSLYEKDGNTILSLEFWCNDEDELWARPDDVLIETAVKDLYKTGLANNRKILDGSVYKIPKCYPVYSRGYKEHLKPLQKWLSSIENLYVIGRYGSFKYNNQDHSMLMGILAAETIMRKQKSDLWEVNTDYETYQEATVITKTGLKKAG